MLQIFSYTVYVSCILFFLFIWVPGFFFFWWSTNFGKHGMIVLVNETLLHPPSSYSLFTCDIESMVCELEIVFVKLLYFTCVPQDNGRQICDHMLQSSPANYNDQLSTGTCC